MKLLKLESYRFLNLEKLFKPKDRRYPDFTSNKLCFENNKFKFFLLK